MAVCWCSLPIDLLGAIAIKLKTIEDFIYFSSVCRSWNHASSLIKQLWEGTPFPWLLLTENNKENPDYIRKVFNLDYKRCYKLNLPETFGARCWGSPYGWIVMVTRDLNVQLFNPITKAKLHFPSCKTLENPITYFEGTKDGEDYYQLFLRIFLGKLIVVKVPSGDYYEFIVMALYYPHSDSKLAFARHSDQSWTSILLKQKHKNPMVDVVTKDDFVYGLYDDGTIVFWKVKEFFVSEPIKPVDFSMRVFEFYDVVKVFETTYLVQSNSNLLMVVRYKDEAPRLNGDELNLDIVYQTIRFDVYKLNFTNKTWDETDDVGDVALFVGCNYSMSASVTSAKCLKPNCIYFTDDEALLFNLPRELGGHDMGVYDIKSRKICEFYKGDDMRSSFCPPTWFIPKL